MQFSFCHKNSHTITASNQKTLNSFPRNKCRLFLRTLVINRVILNIEPQENAQKGVIQGSITKASTNIKSNVIKIRKPRD